MTDTTTKERFREYFKPEDFKCGGCLECEACKHYFNHEELAVREDSLLAFIEDEKRIVREEVRNRIVTELDGLWVDNHETPEGFETAFGNWLDSQVDFLSQEDTKKQDNNN